VSTDRRRTGTRRSLVRSATALFRRHGLAATSVADVCRRSGVTKGVFSHHFPGGRSELAGEVIRQNGLDVAAQLHATAASHPMPHALIGAIFDGYADLMTTKGPDFGCPIAAGAVDGDAGAEVGTAVRTAFRSWRAELTPPLDDDLAALVVAAVEGAILLARAERDPEVVRRIGRALAGLASGRAPR
jgi:TetR/AcrR family transcriptional repressor of lmrAB and yxaGH operons